MFYGIEQALYQLYMQVFRKKGSISGEPYVKNSQVKAEQVPNKIFQP